MVVEQLFAHYDHPRTAILMAHARGVILLAAAQRTFRSSATRPRGSRRRSPATARATKEQMQLAMLRELNLPRLPEPHDVADALADRAVPLPHRPTAKATDEEPDA